MGVAHTVVDEIHELQLLALTTDSRVILTDGHGLRFFPGVLALEHWERELHAHLIVALAQFLELLLCDVEFPARVEVDGVDEEVGVDMVAVCMGADQNLVTLIVLSQLQRGRMSDNRID